MATRLLDEEQAARMQQAALEAQTAKRKLLRAQDGDRYDVIAGYVFSDTMSAQIAELYGGKMVAASFFVYLVILRSIHVARKSPLRGWCDLSQRQLAERAYLSRSTVQKAIEALETVGLVEVEELAYGTRKRNVYLPKVASVKEELAVGIDDESDLEWI